jgi:hypothetical protein
MRTSEHARIKRLASAGALYLSTLRIKPSTSVPATMLSEKKSVLYMYVLEPG